jgi:hypothetical protein
MNIIPTSETNFKNDAHGNIVMKGDLKDKLNKAYFGGLWRRKRIMPRKVYIGFSHWEFPSSNCMGG